MNFDLWRADSTTAFRRRAERFLLAREADHNLLLGLLPVLERPGGHPFSSPILLATVEQAGQVLGCVFRTPPYKLGVTHLPAEAASPVVDAVAEVYASLPAVMGPVGSAEAVARRWAERRDVDVVAGMRQWIQRLERVNPVDQPPGRLRAPHPSERERVLAWGRAFAAEARIPMPRGDQEVGAAIDDDRIRVWDHGGVRSMAGVTGATPNGVRIGWVYTPPELRGRGYATGLVAGLSRRALDAGRRFCFLYTDASNPVSNRIYERIGFTRVSEVMDFEFAPRPAQPISKP